MRTARRNLMAVAGAFLLAVGMAGATDFDPKVTITDLTVVARDAKTATIRFDVSWNDSWRHEINYDAAWVFFKVRADASSEWQPMRLAADRVLNPTGYGQADSPEARTQQGARMPYYQPGRSDYGKPGGAERSREFFFAASDNRDTPLEFLVPDGADGFTGVFLRRAEKGGGSVSAHAVTVVWDAGAAKGIPDPVKAQVRAFGLQMVYVAEGPFYLGSGGTEANAFYAYAEDHRTSPPYKVTGAGAIPTGRKQGSLWARNSAQPEDGGEIPASFPNGYGAFYCMKNHITPRQYTWFLETIPVAQAEARWNSAGKWVRGVSYTGRTHSQVSRKGTAPNYTYNFHVGDHRCGAGCFGMSWPDGATFAAWAGLRPMTELEVEKAVRGPRWPLPDECSPCYWGIGPFSDNAWHAFKGHEPQGEQAVTVANTRGRGFKGTHGNGTPVLPPDWPQSDAVGAGFRCTHYRFTEVDLARTLLSDRLLADVADPRRLMSYKMRAVRTAP
ncbi:MAG: hypothetical protein O2901_12350 [Verrucomicrobia bacterium]|nr:hypothetical protein [Verrucomicrobiota bacterium]